jgi:hypothetical protein
MKWGRLSLPASFRRWQPCKLPAIERSNDGLLFLFRQTLELLPVAEHKLDLFVSVFCCRPCTTTKRTRAPIIDKVRDWRAMLILAWLFASGCRKETRS